MEEWKEYKLGDVCAKIGSGATPKGGKEAYLGGNTSLIRSQNVLDFAFSWDGLAYIDDEQAAKLNGVEIEKGDVLLNITGDSVARVCIVPESALPARVNQHVSIVRGDTEVVLNDYIMYFLQYKKSYLLSLSQGGATRNALTKGMIEDLSIPLPPLSKQAEIVHVLKSLDDKIEVNRQINDNFVIEGFFEVLLVWMLTTPINDNLEQQAQALFKSWFVDFEPFKDGEFVESELGMIPKGWRVGTLGELCSLVSGFAFQSCTYVDKGLYRLVTIKNVQDGYLNSDGAVCLNEVPSRMPIHCLLKIGDILLSLTGNVGRCCFVNEKRLLLNQRVAKIIPNKDSFWGYIYTFFRNEDIKTLLMSIAKGTAQANLSPVETLKLTTIVPTNEVIEKFSKIVNSLYEEFIKNTIESRRLAELRDTLLPRLMSGELSMDGLKGQSAVSPGQHPGAKATNPG